MGVPAGMVRKEGMKDPGTGRVAMGREGESGKRGGRGESLEWRERSGENRGFSPEEPSVRKQRMPTFRQ